MILVNGLWKEFSDRLFKIPFSFFFLYPVLSTVCLAVPSPENMRRLGMCNMWTVRTVLQVVLSDNRLMSTLPT